ncbi:response regulator [bacterium]|nr:response regulator [bacterium]
MTPEHMTILTVDDTPANIRLLTHYLHKQGYKVLTAEDGFEGFKAAIQHKPDLILLDVMMPGTDGYEVCELLKTEEETRDIPVVFLTAKAEVEDRIKGFEMGAVDYITKPFNLTEIATRVRTQLELRYFQQQNRRLLKIINDSGPYFSLGVLIDSIFSGRGALPPSAGDGEAETPDARMYTILEEIMAGSSTAKTWKEAVPAGHDTVRSVPLYQLLADTIDLVRSRYNGPLPIDCDKPDTDLMLSVNQGLAIQALAELSAYTASRARRLDTLEITASRGKGSCSIGITAHGADAGAGESGLSRTSPYAVTAAIAALKWLGGDVVAGTRAGDRFGFSVTLPS